MGGMGGIGGIGGMGATEATVALLWCARYRRSGMLAPHHRTITSCPPIKQRNGFLVKFVTMTNDQGERERETAR